MRNDAFTLASTTDLSLAETLTHAYVCVCVCVYVVVPRAPEPRVRASASRYVFFCITRRSLHHNIQRRSRDVGYYDAVGVE